MLWQKELHDENFMYIDLCSSHPNNPNKQETVDFERICAMYENKLMESIECEFITNKDDNFSLKLRQEGNVLFAKHKYHEAMDKYNRSLCFAVNNSRNLTLTLANRSNCFLHMKMFDRCLIDIDLARNENCPEYLFEELEEREIHCVKSIEDGVQAINREAKLSFEPRKDRPGMAKNLVIFCDSKYGRGVVTTTDINVGETVLLEPIYFGESYVRKYETCTVCLKSDVNLVPCTTCTFALLCSDGCKNVDLHRIECGIRKYPNFGDDFAIAMIIPIIRSILMATRLFSHPDELVSFVEEAIASDPMEIPTTIDDKTTYRAFLKIHKQGLDDIRPQHIHLIYKSLLNVAELAPYFAVEEYRRFLMHLIMHHIAIYKSNKITNQRLIGNVLTDITAISYIFEDDCMGILKTYFNHSCAPNITFYCDSGFVIGKIIRPVKNGEQLFVSYFDNTLALTLEDRKEFGQMYFTCTCDRCASGVDDNTDSHVDPLFNASSDYWFIRTKFSPNRSYPVESERKVIEDKCVGLLKKFGRNAWSYSLEFVMQAYVSALQRSSSSLIPRYHYLTNIVEKRGLIHTVDMFEQQLAQLHFR